MRVRNRRRELVDLLLNYGARWNSRQQGMTVRELKNMHWYGNMHDPAAREAHGLVWAVKKEDTSLSLVDWPEAEFGVNHFDEDDVDFWN